MNMNKLKSNLTLTLNKQTTSKENQKNVTLLSKCKEQIALKQIQMKKKRTAFDNISNATSVTKDASKKSRKCQQKPDNKNPEKENQALLPSGKACTINPELHSSSSTLSACSTTDSVQRDSDIANEFDEIVDWEDIDSMDIKDEFNVCEYAVLIFKYYREREESFIIEDYLKNQPTLNKQMRHLLVDWMVEVQQQLEFNHEVLYLSVKLLDLYLNNKTIEKEKLQLLGGAAMFIACKYEERVPPVIDDFIYVSDNAYDRVELVKMEIDILKTVRFDIGVPLSYTFLRRYAKCVHADMKFLTLARYILELALQEYSFAYVKDSIKACAALYLALKVTFYNDQQTKLKSNITSNDWNATLVHYTEKYLKDFMDCIPIMNSLMKNAPSSKYKTIYKKYSHQVFYEVAKIPPLTDDQISEILA